jgi:asparagine synthetase B (glutamine-hydrolysing)
MCGIAGKISAREITPEQIRAMTDTLLRRGPDAAGNNISRGSYTVRRVSPPACLSSIIRLLFVHVF